MTHELRLLSGSADKWRSLIRGSHSVESVWFRVSPELCAIRTEDFVNELDTHYVLSIHVDVKSPMVKLARNGLGGNRTGNSASG